MRDDHGGIRQAGFMAPPRLRLVPAHTSKSGPKIDIFIWPSIDAILRRFGFDG